MWENECMLSLKEKKLKLSENACLLMEICALMHRWMFLIPSKMCQWYSCHIIFGLTIFLFVNCRLILWPYRWPHLMQRRGVTRFGFKFEYFLQVGSVWNNVVKIKTNGLTLQSTAVCVQMQQGLVPFLKRFITWKAEMRTLRGNRKIFDRMLAAFLGCHFHSCRKSWVLL